MNIERTNAGNVTEELPVRTRLELIEAYRYRTDPISSYQRLRYRTRKNHENVQGSHSCRPWRSRTLKLAPMVMEEIQHYPDFLKRDNKWDKTHAMTSQGGTTSIYQCSASQ